MKCVYCLHKITEVKNTREIRGGVMTWRRRCCPNCKRIFTTKEHAYGDNLFVIKSSGKRQRYIYEKLLTSLISVLDTKKRRDNGNNAMLAKKIAEKMTEHLLKISSSNKSVPTSAIIPLVYKELKKIDPAYADHYIYYSDYRRKIALKEKLIKV